MARFQKPFAAAGPKSAHQFPARAARHTQRRRSQGGKLHGQARPSAQATSCCCCWCCPVILCWLDRPKSLQHSKSAGQSFDQVQKGKKITVTVRRLQKSYSSATPQQRKFHLRTFPCLDENGDEIKKKSSFFRVEPSSRGVKTAPHPQGTVVASRTSRPHSQIPAELNA